MPGYVVLRHCHDRAAVVSLRTTCILHIAGRDCCSSVIKFCQISNSGSCLQRTVREGMHYRQVLHLLQPSWTQLNSISVRIAAHPLSRRCKNFIAPPAGCQPSIFCSFRKAVCAQPAIVLLLSYTYSMWHTKRLGMYLSNMLTASVLVVCAGASYQTWIRWKAGNIQVQHRPD